MKKLETQYSIDTYDCADKINQLIDLVNSQQEAIERLQEHVDHEARHISEPADDKPELVSKARYAEKLGIHDTHRTVTLRIPKGMTVGKAIWSTLDQRDENCLYRLFEQSDTDLQKALDEVQPNE
jgi:hypothetical protein